MAIFRRTVTVPAGGSDPNILAGNKFEFLGRPAAIAFWASQDGAGAPNAVLDLTLGNVVVGDDLAPNTAVTAGNVVRDQDGVGEGVGAAGDRIQLRVRNLSAVDPVNVNVLISISDLV